MSLVGRVGVEFDLFVWRKNHGCTALFGLSWGAVQDSRQSEALLCSPSHMYMTYIIIVLVLHLAIANQIRYPKSRINSFLR